MTSHHTPWQLFAYSWLAFPLAFVGLPIYMHAPEFYATEMNLSLAYLGVVLLLLRAVDAVQDPWLGSLSDRFSANRLTLMNIGALLLVSGFWMLFHPSATSPMLSFVIGVFLSTTGFSVVSINLQALGGLWHSSKSARTTITGWREGVGLFGLIVAAALPTWLSQHTSPAGGFHLLSLIFIPILMSGMLLFYVWQRQAVLTMPAVTANHLGWRALNTPWGRSFFGIYLINNIAAAIPGVLVLFFIKDHLQAPEWVGAYLLLYFISGILGMPVWQWLAKKHGKLKTWLWSMLLSVAVFIWAFSLEQSDLVAFALICVLSGLALGADLALPPAILADQIDQTSTQPLASRAFSLLNFLTKSSLALATGISLPILGLLGYQPGMDAAQNATEPLSLMYALVPSGIKLITAIWLWRFLKLRTS